ncbi:MAG: hypothetical protein SFZ24_03930 [Planctomycetota bacterium]|nr:hypothetical protein [Planctomycetota bacterium]
MKRFMMSSVVLAASSSLAGAGAIEPTAQYFPVSYNGALLLGLDLNGTNTSFGQSFLALTSGALHSIQIGEFFHSEAGNVAQQALRINFFDVTDTGGMPAGAPLRSWSVPASEIPLNVLLSPEFVYTGQPMPIIAGRRYAFSLGTAFGTNVNFNAPYSVGGSFGDPYVDGSGLRIDIGPFDAGLDVGFRVNVNVPGPGALCTFGLAGAAALRRRRR